MILLVLCINDIWHHALPVGFVNNAASSMKIFFIFMLKIHETLHLFTFFLIITNVWGKEKINDIFFDHL